MIKLERLRCCRSVTDVRGAHGYGVSNLEFGGTALKTLLLSTVAALGLATAASAADLPRRAAPPVYAPIPIFTWTGFYAGANAGYGFTDLDDRAGDVYTFTPGTILNSAATSGTLTLPNTRRDRDGFVGGGQVGYNLQLTPGMGVVVGVEADIQYADFNNGRTSGTLTSSPNYTFTGTPGAAFTAPQADVVQAGRSLAFDYFGTVRGRVGYAFDRTLVFATGGFAYAGGGRDNVICGGASAAAVVAATNAGIDCGGGRRDTRTGYTIGGGVEYAFTDSITLKAEALYVDLDHERDRSTRGAVLTTVAGTPKTLFLADTIRRNDDFVVARAGINFKFPTY